MNSVGIHDQCQDERRPDEQVQLQTRPLCGGVMRLMNLPGAPSLEKGIFVVLFASLPQDFLQDSQEVPVA